MGTKRQPSPSELAARDSFENMTGARLEFNETGDPGRADFRLVGDDGATVGLLEVSRLTSTEWQRTRADLGIHGSMPDPHQQFTASPVVTQLDAQGPCWLVTVRPDANMKELRRTLGDLLTSLEDSGIEFLIAGGTRPPDLPPLTDDATALLSLGVLSARIWEESSAHPDHSPCVKAMVTLPGGSIDLLRMLNDAVAAACRDNAAKLTRDGRTHLWLWTDEGTYVAAAITISFMEAKLRQCCPLLPIWLDRVWVAYADEPQPGSPEVAQRVWTATRGEPWTLATKPAPAT